MADILVYMVRKREKTVEQIQKDMPKFVFAQVAKKVVLLQQQLGDNFYLV